MASVNWYRWHDTYDELGSEMTSVLSDTQDHVAKALDDAVPGSISVLSMAAGQSRELIPVLVTHPRGADVSAVLVEFDGRNTDFAEGALQSAGLSNIAVVTGDAGNTSNYASGVPANVVLCCGLFDHLSDSDIHRTISNLPMLCAPGAKVIYSTTKTSKLEFLQSELVAAGFAIATTTVAGHVVGSATLNATALPWDNDVQLFNLQ